MILTGPAIRRAVEEKRIEIDPFDERQLNPASYDLRLGEDCVVYSSESLSLSSHAHYPRRATSRRFIDSKKETPSKPLKISEYGLLVQPGNLYLLHTRERLHTKEFVTVIDGKSSIGRLGLVVHLTAGYGDPGFDGQYTLEVTSVAHDVVVYPGMLFCQARFHRLEGELQQYSGNYLGEAARGPVPSAAWKQFG